MASSSSRGVEHRVHEPRDGGLAIEAAQQRLQQRRLARPDLAGDDDEAGVAFDAVAQVAERLPVDPARVQVVGVGAERERPLAKVVEAFIHDVSASCPASRAGAAPPRARGARRARNLRAARRARRAQ